MKAILAMLFLALACCTFVGCESDMPSNSEPNQVLRRGLSGQGSLTQPDRSEDPLIKENSRVGN